MDSLSLLTDPQAWAAFISLSALEIVLGIDNLVFISLLTASLEDDRARQARRIGLSFAFIFRVMMLGTLTWLVRLTAPLFNVYGMGISWRDIILIGGGLFLIAKAMHEIRSEVAGTLPPKSWAEVRPVRGRGGSDQPMPCDFYSYSILPRLSPSLD